jgi:biotin-dependent carboxylase-like uncharacterized protein
MTPHAVILHPGMLTTVQDLGRSGFASQAVPESGAADTLSLRVGNRILSNADSAAALEFTLRGPTLRFERDAAICVTGARCPQARVGVGDRSRSIRPCVPLLVEAGEPVEIGATIDGARGYLCVRGGFDVPRVMGSRSTLAVVGIGGHEGRALRPGDRLPLAHDPHPPGVSDPGGVGERLGRWLASVHARRVLRVAPGVDADLFGPAAWERLERAFVVSDRCGRAGIRLEGGAVPSPVAGGLLSEGTSVGSIQVPGDGSPMVLGVDRPTTGGYPVIACVVAADLCILGQLRPRDEVRFEAVSVQTARDLYRSQRAELDAFIAPVGEQEP